MITVENTGRHCLSIHTDFEYEDMPDVKKSILEAINCLAESEAAAYANDITNLVWLLKNLEFGEDDMKKLTEAVGKEEAV